MFLVMFLTVLVAQIVDAVMGGLADVLKDFTVSFWGSLSLLEYLWCMVLDNILF
jgi:hypothetical protein